jgi:PAS domain S-box-containing protein
LFTLSVAIDNFIFYNGFGKEENITREFMTSKRKTKAQLIHEIKQLKRELAATGHTDGDDGPSGPVALNSGEYERTLLNNIKDVAYTSDAAGKITYVSPSVETLLGYTPSTIIGRKFLDFIHPDDRKRVQVNYRKLLDGFDQLNEYRLITESGDQLWVLVSSKPLQKNNRIVGIHGIVMDISQQKTKQESIHRESTINAELAKLGRCILSSENLEMISNRILQQVLSSTGSQSGFVVFIEPDTGRIQFPAITADALAYCTNGNGCLAESFTGLGNWILENNHPLLVNDMSRDPQAPALPEKHLPINRFLYVPVLIKDQLAGQIVVANKPADYTHEDLLLLEQIASLYSLAMSDRLTQQSLKRSEERYRTTIDNLDDMVHVVDRDFKLILYNRKLAENAVKFGGLKGSLRGCNIFDTFPFLTPEIREAYLQVLDSGQAIRSLDKTKVHDKVIYIDARRIPVFDSKKNVVRIITILRDVTEFKEIENDLKLLAGEQEKRVLERTRELETKNKALEEEINRHRKTAHALDRSHELTKTLMSTPYIIVLLVEKNGDIVTLNDLAAKSLGSTPEHLKGKNLADVLEKNSFLTRKKLSESIFKDNMPVQFRDQRQDRWFDTTALPVMDTDGTLMRIVIIARDITEQKRIEDERLKTQKLESIGVLAGGIAHDFNNYLTGILGYINMACLKPCTSQATRDLLKKAERITLETKTLSKQLLTFSKGGTPVCRLTDLRGIIHESVEFSTRGSNVRYVLQIQDEPMPAEVDAGQIRQVIYNLILNSIDAMTNGGHIDISGKTGTVQPDNEMNLEPGLFNIVEVKDQGCGIDPKHLTRIFEPYFTTKSNGSGLGLAVSYSIVSNHNGSITAQSQPDHGSLFTLYLPVSESTLPDVTPEPSKHYRGTGTVLVMDDEQFILDVIDIMLDELGHGTVLTSNGDDAVQAFRQAADEGNPIKAVILDLTIPGGQGGVEILKTLREIDPDVKAVVTSGYSNDTILANYRQVGFLDYLAKPFNLSKLQEVMKNILG